MGVRRSDKKELKILADDFGLLGREEAQEIIETCTSYQDGWRKIMELYNTVYMS